MNRYVAEGIGRDLADGKTILYVCNSQAQARNALEEVIVHADRDAIARRPAGAETIIHPSGGRVWFVSINSHGSRGLTGDIAYIDSDVDRTKDHTMPIMMAFREVQLA